MRIAAISRWTRSDSSCKGSAHPHGSDPHDPKHQYHLCDIANGCALSPLTEEVGVTGASVSPDGQFLYYFMNLTEVGKGRLTLKRGEFDGPDRQTVLALHAGHCQKTRTR